MLKVGITGGIGSGKSMVCKIFEMFQIPVYYADLKAREIMNRDEILIEQIKTHFGANIYGPNGLDRAALGAIVFNNREKLDLLNSLVHPATIRDSEAWANAQGDVPYVLKEAALIFESESFHYLDKIIGVHAPMPLRLLRTMKRDNMTREEVLARMDKQMDETIKMRLCDYVINNDERELVIEQVFELHGILCELAEPTTTELTIL
jgi:dephospho-CoA kinase